MVFGLIPDITCPTIRKLIDKIDNWSSANTILWITGFTTKDPVYANHKATWKVLDTNSFQGPAGQVRTYLEPGQILELFAKFSIIHHWEGLDLEHQHGDDPPERHGNLEIVFLKM